MHHTRLRMRGRRSLAKPMTACPSSAPFPGAARVLAAYGYGGNGITFSFMASRILAAQIAGTRRPWFDDFALDRTAP